MLRCTTQLRASGFSSNQRCEERRHTTFIDRAGDMIRGSLHGKSSVAHCDTCASPLQHFDVVAAIAKRDNVGGLDAEVFHEHLQRHGLVITAGRHVNNRQATKLHLTARVDELRHDVSKSLKAVVVVVVKRNDSAHLGQILGQSLDHVRHRRKRVCLGNPPVESWFFENNIADLDCEPNAR